MNTTKMTNVLLLVLVLLSVVSVVYTHRVVETTHVAALQVHKDLYPGEVIYHQLNDLYEKGQFDELKDACRKGRKERPYNGNYLYYLGLAHYHSNEFEEAAQALAATQAEFPSFAAFCEPYLAALQDRQDQGEK